MLKISDSFLIAKLPPHMRLILMTIARDVCGNSSASQRLEGRPGLVRRRSGSPLAARLKFSSSARRGKPVLQATVGG
jgi:hypothetical protein